MTRITQFSRSVLVLAVAATLAGCQSAAQHRADVSDTSGDALTVGTVQRDIELGMSGAEVAEVLGTPNVVTTDEERREVWIYDRVSTQTAFSSSSGGASAGVLGIPGLSNGFLLGSGTASASGSAGAQDTSQRTLTVVIKFDEAGRVRDYSYHTSRF